MNDLDFSGNMIRPFQLETSSLRGRIVRFNTVLNDILTPHDYPQAVSQLLGETVTLCALLSSMLKFEGVFTLQASGDGPVSMLVADMMSNGNIRGCASFDEERLDALGKDDLSISSFLGDKGYLAFTVDQGGETDRYQGIVELKGSSLVECVQHYFMQSEQIDTGIMIAVGQRNDQWCSSGLMLQHMPPDGGNGDSFSSNTDEDDWRRAMVLMQTCTKDELLEPDLNSHEILLRLFHEEGVRVFEPTPLQHQCRCSTQKVENVVSMLSEEEQEEMLVDGELILTCEFCSKDYVFDPSILHQKTEDAPSDNDTIS